jgi:hypothetical protein
MNDWRHTRERQNFYRRMGSTSEPRRRPFLKSRLVGVVLPAEPFGVEGPTKIRVHVESKSTEKETCAVHIAHEYCPQHPEKPKLHHCQNKMG